MAPKVELIIGGKSYLSGPLTKAANAVKKFGSMAKRVFIGVTAAGASILGLGAYFSKAGSDADETGTKFDQVFRGIQGSANTTAAALAKDFGLASSTSKKLLSDTGDLLGGFGMAEDEALKLADQTNRLAIDLASFTNYSGGAAGASQALTKLLLGETEQAKALGIVVRQGSKEFKDAVIARMAERGETTLQAKAHVALQMAMDQSKKAMGDYARTSQGVANRTRLLSESWKEFRETVGQTINDSAEVAEVLGLLSAKIGQATVKLKEFVASGGMYNMIASVKTFGIEAKLAFHKMWTYAKASLETIWLLNKAVFANIAKVTYNAAVVTKNAWKGTTDNVGYWLAKMWAKVRGEQWNITPPKPPFEDLLKGTVELTDAIDEVAGVWVDALDSIAAESDTAAEQVASAWETAAKRQADAAEAAAAKQAAAAANAATAQVQAIEKVSEAQQKAQDQARKIERDIANKKADDAIKKADEQIAQAQGRIAELAKPTSQRRAEAKQARLDAFQKKKDQEALDKLRAQEQAGGKIRMTREQRERAERARMREQMNNAGVAKGFAEMQKEMQAKMTDSEVLKKQLTELQDIKKNLKENLRLA